MTRGRKRTLNRGAALDRGQSWGECNQSKLGDHPRPPKIQLIRSLTMVIRLTILPLPGTFLRWIWGIGRPKMQPVTNGNEVSADSAFAVMRRRCALRAPFLDSRKSRNLRSKPTNATKDALSEASQLNFKPAHQGSVCPDYLGATYEVVCRWGSVRKLKEKGVRLRPHQSDHSALYKPVACGTIS